MTCGERRGAADEPARAAPTGSDRRGDASRGQATVELALLLPVVVLLLLAALQVGLVARDLVLVHHAAREAARAAATDPRSAIARQAAEDAGGLTSDRLRVELSGGREPGERLRVEVRYRIPTDVPLIGPLVGDRTASVEVTMRVE